MKNIVYARVDDRLLHGEVVTAWVPSKNINHIVIVDDEIAADKFQKRILKTLSPTNVKVSVASVDSSASYLQKENNPKERILILTKSPLVYERLVEKGVVLSQVNLGGMGLRGERKPFVKNVACSPDEVDAIRKMDARGIHVFYQLVPEQKLIEIKNLL